MIDAQQWLIDLMIHDIGVLVGGLILLFLTLELLVRIKEWLS